MNKRNEKSEISKWTKKARAKEGKGEKHGKKHYFEFLQLGRSEGTEKGTKEKKK